MRFFGLSIALLTLSGLGCGEATTEAAPGTVEIASNGVEIMIGGVDTLEALARDAKGLLLPDNEVGWSSSSSLVVAVDGAGIVRGVATGSAFVRASHGEVSDSVLVTVTADATASQVVGAGGGVLTLPTGTQVTIGAGELATATSVRVVETPTPGVLRIDDPAPRLTVTIGGGQGADTVAVTIRWMLPAEIPEGERLLFQATLPQGAIAILGANSASLATGSILPSQLVGDIVGWSFDMLAVTGSVVVRAILSPQQNSATCADAYQLREAAREPGGTPDVAVVLIHGWQYEMACWRENPLVDLPITDFTHFQPLEETWSELAAQIADDAVLGARVRTFSFRYPSTLTPQQNAIELLRLLRAHPSTPKAAKKLLIVGHSMGGLVARALDAIDTDGLIGGIVTLGTPHLGSTIADADFVHALLPSDGLNALGTNVFNDQIALPTTAPLHAVRGDIPCDAAFADGDPFGWIFRWWWALECINGNASPAGRGTSDGIVAHHSATPEQANSYAAPAGLGETITHRDLPNHPAVRLNVISQLIEFLPPLEYAVGDPERLFSIGGNPHSLLVIADELFVLASQGGTNGNATFLHRYSLSNRVGSSVLPVTTPQMQTARSLRSDGVHLYWQSGWTGYSINRIPLSGGPVETVVDSLPSGLQYELFGPDVIFVAPKPDGTLWLRRVAKFGGIPDDVVQLSHPTRFAVADGEVYFEDCPSRTVFARTVSGAGASRVVATNLDGKNLCSDDLRVVDGTLFIIQVRAEESVVRSVPTSGGELILRAGGLSNPIEPVVDATHLYLIDAGSDEIVRFRLSDFAKTIMAGRNCGGLAVDNTHVYWSTEIAPAPATPCLDGVGGPIVRLPKAQ